MDTLASAEYLPALREGSSLMSWTDEKILKLRNLWSEGLTTGEIGKRLDVSKNAVVGKTKFWHHFIKRQKKVAAPKKEKKVFTLTDLSSQTCRWPIGDPKHDDFHFCGATVVPGKSYCAEHCAAAYVGSNKPSQQSQQNAQNSR